MANENARRDDNRVTSMLGVTNDANQEIRNLLIDPATGALLVTGAGGGAGANTFAISATDTTPGTFTDEIFEGDGIDFTIANIGANENLTISVDADNGLEFVGGTLYWGGTLIQDTIIDGNAQAQNLTFTGIDMMSFNDMTDFTVGTLNDVSQVNLVGQDGVQLLTGGLGSIQIGTPGVANATVSNGWVLQLQSALNGEAEWVDPSTIVGAVQSEICDADADTCVEVERTPDDDTIRMKANGTDVGTMTDSAYDFTVGEYSTKRGSFLGFDGVGFEYIDSVTPAKTAFVSLNEVAGNGFIQTRVTDGAGSVSNENTSPFSWSARSQNGAESSEFTTSKDQARIRHDNEDYVIVEDDLLTFDVRTGNIEINEGTTASGSATAQPGYVLTCINGSTGRAKWAPVPPEPLFAARQDANQATQLVGGGLGSFTTVQYDTETVTSPNFTLTAPGVITCNVAGDYIITTDTNMGTLPTGGTVGIFVMDVRINGFVSGDAARQMYERTSEYQSVSVTQSVTLAVNDVITTRITRSGGGRNLTSASSMNRITIGTRA